MKKRLTFRELLAVASMLFGLFFGAGNLIFPASMGQMAGRGVWAAAAGFLATGVGLPLLGVAALGLSREEGLLGLSRRLGPRAGLGLTCALYLTIGPFFAIPRCASVSWAVGFQDLAAGAGQGMGQAVFSLVFFAAVLLFSLRPGELLTWVGRVLNPLFLALLAVLLLRALTAPLGTIGQISPTGDYAAAPFAAGLLEGYNTMDALAGLAFGILVVDAVRRLGVQAPGDVAKCTVAAGLASAALMALIYVLVAAVGAQSRGALPIAGNGGEALAQIARRYFGSAGAVLLAATVTLACLKTAVGLVTSCGATFAALFSHGRGYRAWAAGFCALSFLIANLGLESITAFSQPVLVFLYPLAIVLIALTLLGKLWGNDPLVLRWTAALTAAGAVPDLLRALPEPLRSAPPLERALAWLGESVPLARLGFGWVWPALAGFLIALVLRRQGGRT